MACDETVPTQEEIWLEITTVVAKASRCSRKQIGAVLVKHGQIISVAHNGPQPESTSPFHCPRGALSYEEQPPNVGYDAVGTGCFELHAEELALSRSTTDPRGGTMYINGEPCSRCRYALRVCGTTWVVLGVAKPPGDVRGLS